MICLTAFRRAKDLSKLVGSSTQGVLYSLHVALNSSYTVNYVVNLQGTLEYSS